MREAFTVNEELMNEAAKRLGADYVDNIEVTMWNESFPTTAGPRRGTIAGQAFTSFIVLGFAYGTADPIMWCAGIWQKWNGVDFTWKWKQSQHARENERTKIARLRAELQGHKEADESRRKLVRELDVCWNGEEGAAKQASLCDIVGQIEKELPKLHADLQRLQSSPAPVYTNRMAHEEAAGMGLEEEFFTRNGIDPISSIKPGEVVVNQKTLTILLDGCMVCSAEALTALHAIRAQATKGE